ncbi:MAG: DUF2796 domain-containing protein [Pseudomonadota bacterium]
MHLLPLDPFLPSRVRRGLPAMLLLALAGSTALGIAHAGKAHEHGVARLDIAVEAARVVIELDTPLDNLVGFERAPRTDAERAAVAAAVARLRDAATLFRIDGAAGCTAGKVELASAPLGLGKAPAPAQGSAHADLEGSFEFGCTAGAQAGVVEVGLFEAFPRLKRLEVQVATPRGQAKATLRRPNARITLPR